MVTSQQHTVPPNSTPQPRTATPNRHVNGVVETAPPMPSKAAAHGAPARRYLNEKVTGVLLEGMKRLAADRYVHLVQGLRSGTDIVCQAGRTFTRAGRVPAAEE